MQKVGVYEEQVLKLELEVSLQEKKKQMIQTAINRREAIDLEAIEEQLEEERAGKLSRLNQEYKVCAQQKETLTAEEKEELQTLYKEILRDFHSQVHSDMTASQKNLYEKALEAYKRQNLEELRLIHEMLFSADAKELSFEISGIVSEDEDETIKEIAKNMMEDYSLAAELYPCFEELEEDVVLRDARRRYEEKQDSVLAEIEDILSRFPFIAEETLRNGDKLKAYLDSLGGRMNSAKLRLEELQSEIKVMMGE